METQDKYYITNRLCAHVSGAPQERHNIELRSIQMDRNRIENGVLSSNAAMENNDNNCQFEHTRRLGDSANTHPV